MLLSVLDGHRRAIKISISLPIFASVLSIVIALAGVIAVWTLLIAQYPEITPPTVEVSASYQASKQGV